MKNAFEKIRIDRFRLTTEFVHTSKEKAAGFMGKVAYRIPETVDEESKRRINALADFAFYSGVGKRTDRGMGQARRKEK